MALIVPDIKNDEVFLRVMRALIERELRLCVAGGGVDMTGLISYTNHHGVGSHDELHKAGVEDLSLLVSDGEVDVVFAMVRGEPIRRLRQASSAM